MKIEIGYSNAANMEKFLKHRFLPAIWQHIWMNYDGGQTGNVSLAQSQAHWLLFVGKGVHRCFMDDYGNLKR